MGVADVGFGKRCCEARLVPCSSGMKVSQRQILLWSREEGSEPCDAIVLCVCKCETEKESKRERRSERERREMEMEKEKEKGRAGGRE